MVVSSSPFQLNVHSRKSTSQSLRRLDQGSICVSLRNAIYAAPIFIEAEYFLIEAGYFIRRERRAFTSTPASFSSVLIIADAFSSPKPRATADSRFFWTTGSAGIGDCRLSANLSMRSASLSMSLSAKLGEKSRFKMFWPLLTSSGERKSAALRLPLPCSNQVPLFAQNEQYAERSNNNMAIALATTTWPSVPRERRPEINASIEGRSTPPEQHLVPLRPRGLKVSPH